MCREIRAAATSVLCWPVWKGALLIALLASNPLVSSGEQFILPEIAASLEGDSNNQWPFVRPESAPLHWQQVYEGRLFGPVGAPMRITGIAFRADAEFGIELDGTIADISISLSTTQRDEFSLSFLNLNLNRGPDSTEVYPRQNLHVLTSHTSTGPNDFDFEIAFEDDFIFDPSVGSLLLEVKNFSAEKIGNEYGNLDSAWKPGSGIARAWNFSPALTYGTDSNGLVTRFSYVLVPEPSAGMLLICIIGANVGMWRQYVCSPNSQ